MRRLTILLLAVGALLLIPAAQAFAEEEAHVNIAGTGGGSVTSETGEEELEGTPPINCSYKSPGPATGVCDNVMGEIAATGFGIYVVATADPGSEFAGWTIQQGTSGESLFGAGCEEGPGAETFCVVYQPSGTPEAFDDTEITAHFTSAGPSGPELTLTKEGTGSGTVASNPAGIECGGTCKASFETNAKVTLTASPSAGSTFVSWKGCEKGGANGRQCTVTMDQANTVNAKFLTAYDVTVNRVGSGLGKVSSSPGGVLCLSNCSSTKAAFKEGTSVTLSAAASKNYVFTEWTGECSGSSLTCSLGSLGADKTVGVKFTAAAQHNLTVTKSGGGNGTAKSNLAGINCGATCSSMAAAYFQSQEVELTATPSRGSTFGGWSGACSGTGACKIAISAAKSVTAEFK